MSTPESNWSRVQALFHAASDLPSSERAEFLARECDGDLNLVAEVESLLNFNEQPTYLIKGAIEGAAAAATASSSDDQGFIGPYKIVRLLGRGGMGKVYEAFRADDHFEKRVAIKVMYPGAFDDHLLERFRIERQILANLEHPNIARLLDGGALHDGMPYLVMEFVEGLSIDAYAKQLQLDVPGRLALMRKVFQAVIYAHRHLVIHRDLKPANILVTPDGEPKLVDFGIAKLLDPDAALGMTRTMEMALTPEYASPEQIRGEATTTATDVYALGAVLYELLSGQRVLNLNNKSLGEMERAICQTDPPAPSVAASKSDSQLAHELAGDLDTIVLKALRKDPAQRYPTVERLEDDVRRYLYELPITARPPTLRYRSVKFVRRHPVAVVASILAITFLVVFGIGMAILARRLAVERDRATEQQARAQQVSEFLASLFKVSDPSESRGNAVTARDLLDKGAATITKRLSNQPQVQTAMLDTMAKAYEGLGLYSRAESLYNDSLHIRESHGAGAPELARSYFNIAFEKFARDQDYPQAEALASRALAIYRANAHGQSTDQAECLNLLGKLSSAQGKYADAVRLQREALAIDTRFLGNSNTAVAQVESDLAGALSYQGDLVQAVALFQHALSVRSHLLGEEDPKTLDSMEGLGLTLDSQHKLNESEMYLRKVLAGRKRLYGEFHHGTAIALVNLADVLDDEKKWDQATSLFQEAITVQRQTMGDTSPSLASMENDFALLLRDQGKYAEAEAQFRQACATYQKTVGVDHPFYALCLMNLTRTLLAENRLLSEAEMDVSQALAIDKARFGALDPHVARASTLLAQVLEQRKNVVAAERAYQDALNIAQKNSAISNELRGTIETRYGVFLSKTHRPGEAQPLLQNALAIEIQLHGIQSDEANEVKSALAESQMTVKNSIR